MDIDVAPAVKNPDEIRRAVRRQHPPLLRDAGIEGTILLSLFIDELGRVQRRAIVKCCGLA
jgi:hypothetical protein